MSYGDLLWSEFDAAVAANPLPWRVDENTGDTVDANGCKVPRDESLTIEMATHLVGQINKMAK